MQETWVKSLGWEDPLEEGLATHSSILARRIPWRSLEGYRSRDRKKGDTTEPHFLLCGRNPQICTVRALTDDDGLLAWPLCLQGDVPWDRAV